jgi:hypothetical protein
MDIRGGKLRLFGARRIGHWTPRYIFDRVVSQLQRWRWPEDPWLVREAVVLLEKMLRPGDVGIEWGAGNSTRWFAQRTRHLISLESDPDYCKQVADTLRERGLANVDLECIPVDYVDDERVMWESAWVQRVARLPDDSLDYALVDSAPRGCLCAAVAPKLRDGGLLILDNANWYIATPPEHRHAPGSRVPGDPPLTPRWKEFLELSAGWRRVWTGNGISTTVIFIKG